MEQVKFLSPFRCKLWHLHDRLEEYVTERTCKKEIESFSSHGQLVPALGRPVLNDPEYDVEIIYGARRLFVARHLNVPLGVEVRPLTDIEAVIAMDLENRQRKDVSAYERGLSYARWLRNGLFKNQDDLARTIGLSASHVSRLLKLGRLPAVIVDAFQSPSEICESWGINLAGLLHDDLKRRSVIRAARTLVNERPRPASNLVYQKLLKSCTKRNERVVLARDRIAKGKQGETLFRITEHKRSIAIVLPIDRVSRSMLNRVEALLFQVMQSAAHPEDFGERLHGATTQVLDGLG